MYKSDIVQSILSFSLKIGSGLGAYVLFTAISRLTGAENFGAFSIVFSLALILGMLGSMGLQVFVVREVSLSRAVNDKRAERAVYAFAVRVLTISLPVTFALYLGVVHFAIGGNDWTEMVIGAVLACLYAVSQATFGMLRMQESTLFAIATRDVLWRVAAIPTVFVLALWLTGMSVGLLGLLVWLVPIVIWHLVRIRRHLRQTLAEPRGAFGDDWIQSSLGLGLIAVISSADFYIYTILIGVLMTTIEAGLFFASLKTAELLNMFLMAVTLVISPHLSRLVAERDVARLQQHCNFGLVLQTVPLVVAAAILLPASQWILTIFDPNYAPWWPLLWILAGIMLFNSLTGATGLLMQVGGMHWLQVGLQGGFLIISIALLPLLVEIYGVYGAAFSFAISKVLWNVAAIYFIRRKLGVDPSVLGLFRQTGGGLGGALSLAREQMSRKKATS